MNAAAIIDEVVRYGGRLSPNGDKLHVSTPKPLPADLMSRLREHKAELLAALTQEAIPTFQRRRIEQICREKGIDAGSVFAHLAERAPATLAAMASWQASSIAGYVAAIAGRAQANGV